MKKWKYYIRSENADTQEIINWPIDREKYMSIRKFLIKYKGMHEDYCSRSGTKYITGNQGILIYRTEIKDEKIIKN